jgi:hypothetical protein
MRLVFVANMMHAPSIHSLALHTAVVVTVVPASYAALVLILPLSCHLCDGYYCGGFAL